MASFKRQISLNGKFKDICVSDGHFIDAETGEEIPVIEILEKIYGKNIFTLTTAYKSDEDIE